LHVADNKLHTLSVQIVASLKELVVCDLRNNHLAEIKAQIWMLPLLRTIDVSGNDLSSPPLSVVRKGKGHVLSYFRALEIAAATRKLSLNSSELTYLPQEVRTISFTLSFPSFKHVLEYLCFQFVPFMRLTVDLTHLP
jgi:hypothetical protein